MALLVQRGDSLGLGSTLINFQISITIWNLTERVKKKLHDRDQFSSKLSPKLKCVKPSGPAFVLFGVERNLKVNALVKRNIKTFLSSIIENIC